MLFNLFGKKESSQGDGLFKEFVWMNSKGKFAALADLYKNDPLILFVAWFADTAKTFREFLAPLNIEESKVVLAKELHNNHQQQHIVFIEHYPLHEKELALVESLHLTEAIVYSAMDEPLFKHLGSDKIIPVMKMMGMKETESIQHPMVTKSIMKGQEKIAAAVIVEQTANSQEEWMKKNMKINN
ncbi:MAG: hypothetical protein ABJA78_13765 [Ferruginibacter sp.]